MTTYHIDHTDETINATNHRAAYQELCRRLDVSGPRALEATGPGATRIRASLYDGEDYIRDRAGRVIYRNA